MGMGVAVAAAVAVAVVGVRDPGTGRLARERAETRGTGEMGALWAGDVMRCWRERPAQGGGGGGAGWLGAFGVWAGGKPTAEAGM